MNIELGKRHGCRVPSLAKISALGQPQGPVPGQPLLGLSPVQWIFIPGVRVYSLHTRQVCLVARLTHWRHGCRIVSQIADMAAVFARNKLSLEKRRT